MTHFSSDWPMNYHYVSCGKRVAFVFSEGICVPNLQKILDSRVSDPDSDEQCDSNPKVE